jgi:dihydropteroate synthase
MFTLNCKGQLITIKEPIVMGILNITPDSFYKGSRLDNNNDLLRMAEQMIHDGATILDIGGQSTRPGSERVPDAEEMKRVIPQLDLFIKLSRTNHFS